MEGITKHIFAGTKRVATIKGTDMYYIHTDHLQSSSVMTDEAGNDAQKVFYYPYGEIKESSGYMDFKYKYTGKEWDAETGLYYYGARYYDPKLARFISADTIVPAPFYPQSFNRYSYAINNPIVLRDLDGHCYSGNPMGTTGSTGGGGSHFTGPSNQGGGGTVGAAQRNANGGGSYGGYSSYNAYVNSFGSRGYYITFSSGPNGGEIVFNSPHYTSFHSYGGSGGMSRPSNVNYSQFGGGRNTHNGGHTSSRKGTITIPPHSMEALKEHRGDLQTAMGLAGIVVKKVGIKIGWEQFKSWFLGKGIDAAAPLIKPFANEGTRDALKVTINSGTMVKGHIDSYLGGYKTWITGIGQEINDYLGKPSNNNEE